MVAYRILNDYRQVHFPQVVSLNLTKLLFFGTQATVEIPQTWILNTTYCKAYLDHARHRQDSGKNIIVCIPFLLFSGLCLARQTPSCGGNTASFASLWHAKHYVMVEQRKAADHLNQGGSLYPSLPPISVLLNL